MPNDCTNYITVTGDEQTILLLHNTKFDFNFFIPAPTGVNELSGDKLIDWRYDNWGTKWAPYEYKLLQKGKRGMRARFNTAWFPPQQFLEFLLQKYPDLWIKCEWHVDGSTVKDCAALDESSTHPLANAQLIANSHKGGRAGVLVGEDRTLESFEWNDLCPEEEMHFFEE